MDFSKAFDKVGHLRLLEKLKYYGIRGKTSACISSFLMDRKQIVLLERDCSYEANVLSGVPQGSVLGLCLFFYIKDLPELLNSTVRLFADDTIAYLAINSEIDLINLLNDLEKLAQCEEKWQMEFHHEKCQIFTLARSRIPVIYHYAFHRERLCHVSSAKYLGVTLSKD